jgi:hypothetical protein
MSDQIEYRIGQHRARMTEEQAAYWNRKGPLGPFLFSQLHGATIQLGGYWVTLEGAM